VLAARWIGLEPSINSMSFLLSTARVSAVGLREQPVATGHPALERYSPRLHVVVGYPKLAKAGGKRYRLVTGYANSPYQPLSSFAGNWLVISPEGLVEDGLVGSRDCDGCLFPSDVVDYDAVVAFKHRLLGTAWHNFSSGTPGPASGI
jgi:hypothetical protein